MNTRINTTHSLNIPASKDTALVCPKWIAVAILIASMAALGGPIFLSCKDLIASLPQGISHAVGTIAGRQNELIMLGTADCLGFLSSIVFMTYVFYTSNPKKPDINTQDEEGRTALHLAIEKDQKESVQALIDGGADVNIRDHTGLTPLHLAAINQDTGIIISLLDKGADINARENSGLSPLHLAAMGNIETLSVLIEKGSEVNARDLEGRTPLHQAAMLAKSSQVKMLLEKGAKATVQDSNGLAPLHIAAMYGDTEILSMLIHNGAEIDVKNLEGKTPLQMAIDSNLRNNIRYLQKYTHSTSRIDLGNAKVPAIE